MKNEKITLTKEELKKMLLEEYKKGFQHGKKSIRARAINAATINADGKTYIFRGTAVKEGKDGE